MGLFDSFKKAKNAEYRVNKQPATIELLESHIHVERVGKQFDIFYTDIRNIEKVPMGIKLETSVEKYNITANSMKNRKLVEGLYSDIVELMATKK